jgi:hypothetical protein
MRAAVRSRVGFAALAPVALAAGLTMVAVAGPATRVGAQPVPSATEPGAAGPAATGAPDVSGPDGRRADGSIIVNGPRRTGQPEPSLGQRVVDTLIWVWLVAALVGGTAWWVWSGRTRPDAAAPDPSPPSGPTVGPH